MIEWIPVDNSNLEEQNTTLKALLEQAREALEVAKKEVDAWHNKTNTHAGRMNFHRAKVGACFGASGFIQRALAAINAATGKGEYGVNDIPTPHQCNLLSNIRAGYAVQSPQGAKLFEESEQAMAAAFCSEDSRRRIQPVILAEQSGRICQLPIPSGWATHKETTQQPKDAE